jgi:hypothetical protein
MCWILEEALQVLPADNRPFPKPHSSRNED